jgi:hypothetical protein
MLFDVASSFGQKMQGEGQVKTTFCCSVMTAFLEEKNAKGFVVCCLCLDRVNEMPRPRVKCRVLVLL